jgi:hypothetical protein
MTTQRYIVKRVGDDFIIVRSDLSEVVSRIGYTMLGGWLIRWGMNRSGIIAVGALLAGGWIGWRGIKGEDSLSCLQQTGGQTDRESEENGPSYQDHPSTGSGQLPSDQVDEAVMESFPASDPPSSMRVDK